MEVESSLGRNQEDVVSANMHHRPLDVLLAGFVSPAEGVFVEGFLHSIRACVRTQQRLQILPEMGNKRLKVIYF